VRRSGICSFSTLSTFPPTLRLKRDCGERGFQVAGVNSFMAVSAGLPAL